MKDDYITSDLSLASVLVIHGHSLIQLSKADQHRFNFHFHKSIDLEQCVDEFWNQELCVEPMTLAQATKLIKSRIYSYKQ